MPRTKVHVPEGMYEVIGEPYNKDLFIVAVPAIDVARAQGMSSSYITEIQMMQRKMNEDHQRKMDIESGGPIRPRTAIVDDMEDESKKIDKVELVKQMWEMSSKPIKMDDSMDAMINQMAIPVSMMGEPNGLSDEAVKVLNYPRGIGKTTLMAQMIEKHADYPLGIVEYLHENGQSFLNDLKESNKHTRPPLGNPPDWVDEEVRESPRDRDNRIIDGG